MFYARSVVESAADTRFEPVRVSMLEAPSGQNEVNLFGTVAVIRIAHMRRQQGHPNGKVASILQALRPDDRGIGMPVRPIVARERTAGGSRRPGQPGLKRREGLSNAGHGSRTGTGRGNRLGQIAAAGRDRGVTAPDAPGVRRAS